MGYSRRGGTFADVIVAVTLIACLIPAGMAVVQRSRETANRVMCASNLKQIGQAILLYGNENGKDYPRTRYVPETADKPNVWTGANSVAPYAEDGPAANDVTAAYRRLLATQDLVPEVFLCPNSPVSDVEFARSRATPNYANFTDERELSYSFANPYPTAAVRDAGYKLTIDLTAEFAVAADISPGVAPPDGDVTAVASTDSARNTKRGNSPNHDRDGQNVLYGDGHVEFQRSPFVGVGRDNIFTFGSGGTPTFGVAGPPAHVNDSVLLPTADAARWARANAILPATIPNDAIWIGLVVLAVIVGIVGWVRRDRRPLAPPPAASPV